MASLRHLVESHNRAELTESVLPALLQCILDISKSLQQSHHVNLAGSANVFGDGQLNVDILAENLVRDALAKCPSVVTASSEEDPIEKSTVPISTEAASETHGERYTVAFDPLDGSSIIGANWTVGTIIGIWDGNSALNQLPSEKQVAAILGVFGPRTTAIVALRTPGSEPTCIEIGLSSSSAVEKSLNIEIIRPQVRLAEAPFKTRYFAPANLRAAAESEAYMHLITDFALQKYTLRYSGGLVPDVVHGLVKGHGIYISPVTSSSQAKLRRLYELCPIALIIECCGGQAIDPTTGEDILSTSLQGCDERAGLICGNAEEVEMVREKLSLSKYT